MVADRLAAAPLRMRARWAGLSRRRRRLLLAGMAGLALIAGARDVYSSIRVYLDVETHEAVSDAFRLFDDDGQSWAERALSNREACLRDGDGDLPECQLTPDDLRMIHAAGLDRRIR